MWLSLVERLVRDQEAGSSNLLTPTWRKSDGHEGVAAQFLISVPKRRLRHAVDRVTVRRRIREAYRLNRALLSTPAPIDVAFIYLADSVVASDKIHRAMRRLLAEMSQKEVEQ